MSGYPQMTQIPCHREERSDAAIQGFETVALDCFAPLAMTDPAICAHLRQLRINTP
ncbi:MAG TPA: hypothetical protein VKS60_00225 [Stellaceae bacterium]|nr:hypothetical protein [Stellaceae bacterium]